MLSNGPNTRGLLGPIWVVSISLDSYSSKFWTSWQRINYDFFFLDLLILPVFRFRLQWLFSLSINMITLHLTLDTSNVILQPVNSIPKDIVALHSIPKDIMTFLTLDVIVSIQHNNLFELSNNINWIWWVFLEKKKLVQCLLLDIELDALDELTEIM